MTTKKKASRRVAICNPEIEITVVATIAAPEMEDLEEALADALDALRQYGSADVVKRRVTAEVVE